MVSYGGLISGLVPHLWWHQTLCCEHIPLYLNGCGKVSALIFGGLSEGLGANPSMDLFTPYADSLGGQGDQVQMEL